MCWTRLKCCHAGAGAQIATQERRSIASCRYAGPWVLLLLLLMLPTSPLNRLYLDRDPYVLCRVARIGCCQAGLREQQGDGATRRARQPPVRQQWTNLFQGNKCA